MIFFLNVEIYRNLIFSKLVHVKYLQTRIKKNQQQDQVIWFFSFLNGDVQWREQKLQINR